MAAEPQDGPAGHAPLSLPDVRLVGAAARPLLQRQLHPRPGQLHPPPRPARRRRLVRDLGHRGPTSRRRAGRGSGDVGRRTDAGPGAQRLPRGVLLHLLVQSDFRRRRPGGRPVLRPHRGHGPGAESAPLPHPAGAGGTVGSGEDGRGGVPRSPPPPSARISTTCRSPCCTCWTAAAPGAKLAGQTGLDRDTPAGPAVVDLDGPGVAWPFRPVAETGEGR